MDVNAIADVFGTPTYVYDLDVIAKQIQSLQSFDVIRFAQKACPNLAILDFMRRLGVVLDAVSLGELRRALAAGYPAKADDQAPPIVYTADVFDETTLRELMERKIHINCGSPDMIWRWGQLCPGSNITLRVNPGFGHGHSRKTNTGGPLSKHGIWHAQLDECLQTAQQFNLAVTGLHMHIGSGCDLEHLSQVVAAMERAALEVGRSLTTISAGGGLPVPYHPQDEPLDVAEHFQRWDAMRQRLADEFGHPVRLEIEPGRFLVAEAGLLVTEVLTVKKTEGHTFYLVDAGFNQLARPVLYGAYHPISVCPRRPDERRDVQPAIVGGPLCESGDVFTQREGGLIEPRELPKARVGDRIVIGCAGAYGAAMSSTYNSLPLAAEVALYHGQTHLIRKRQTIDELLQREAASIFAD